MSGYRAKPVAGSPLNRADPLAHGLAGAWPLSEKGGLVARDTAGSRRDGSLVSAWVAGSGPYGSGLYLTGGNRVSVAGFPALGGGDLTVALLFRPRSWPGAFTGVMENPTGNDFRIFFNTNGELNYLQIGNSGAASSSSVSCPVGVVSLLTVVRTGSAVSVYVNGVVKASLTQSTFSGSAGTLYFGQNSGNTNPDADYYGVWVARAAWSPQAVRAHAADPFRPFRRRRVPVPLGVPTSQPPSVSDYVAGFQDVGLTDYIASF